MHPFTKWFFFYWWNKAVWLFCILLQCIHALRNATSLFSRGGILNLTHQSEDQRSLLAASLKYAQYYLQTASRVSNSAIILKYRSMGWRYRVTNNNRFSERNFLTLLMGGQRQSASSLSSDFKDRNSKLSHITPRHPWWLCHRCNPCVLCGEMRFLLLL